MDREGVLKLQMYTRRMSDTAKARLQKLGDRRPTPGEQALLGKWRSTTLQWGGLASLFAFLAVRLPPWPLGTGSATVVACVSGVAVGAMAAAKEAAAVMAKIIDLPGRSDLVDTAICPSLLELDGCVRDERCAAALRSATSTFRDAGAVIDLLHKCKARHTTTDDDVAWWTDTASSPPWDSRFPAQPSSDAADDA